MKPANAVARGILVLVLTLTTITTPAATPEELSSAAAEAAEHGTTDAVTLLREAGPAGLAALLSAVPKPEPLNLIPPPRQPVDDAIDAVAAQRDARHSGLYWFTNFESAKSVSRETGKPILSLRLLGNLSEELSCANSRFFRTVLYADPAISAYLRDNYVLHWQSVRKVPVIEIDFGDGRKIRRTITGNSIHYILDSRGRLVDGLPGLYTPAAFLAELESAAELARRLASLDESDYLHALREHLRSGIDAATLRRNALLGNQDIAKYPDSEEARTLLAADFAKSASVSQPTRNLVSYMNARTAMRATMSKSMVELPIFRMVRNLEDSLAKDTGYNEYVLRPQLRGWIVESSAPLDVNTFNPRVYAELFLTPASDPWLGLLPPDQFSALENNGVQEPPGYHPYVGLSESAVPAELFVETVH